MNVRIRRANHPDLEVEVGAAEIIVGRSGGGADVTLDDDPSISRRHGRLWLQEGEVWYEDLGSANGSWSGGLRLKGPTRLSGPEPITVGQAEITPGPVTVPEGMELKMEISAQDDSVSRVLTSQQSTVYITALYDFVQTLLRSTSRELMHTAVSRIREVVPAAQRISLVAWPPRADGSFRPLIPGEAPISLSLGRYAVESGQALLVSEAEAPDPQVGSSVQRHGIRSAVYVPLVEEGQPIGLLCVDTPEPTLPFTFEDVQFIRALGDLLSAALAAESLREEARRAEVEARERAAHSQALASFLQIASHDLKNPLASIRLSAYMLGRAELEPPQRELVDSISTSVSRSLALIHTYLELSAADGQLRLETELVDPFALIDDEVALLRRGTERTLPEFHNRTAGGPVLADPSKLRQILANLLSNAAKYSPDGGEVDVELERGPQEVVFRVRDRGVGISEADCAELFQQFRRVGDQGLASGTGLGLWLTRSLVEAHGGRIWVESAPGVGSTFSFSLPQ